jgi:hypothetical protein
MLAQGGGGVKAASPVRPMPRVARRSKQDFVEAPTDDRVTRRPQRAETGRKAWAAVGQQETPALRKNKRRGSPK